MTEKEELVTRWIDGELTPGQELEFKKIEELDLDFCASFKAASEDVREALRSEFNSEVEVPHGDFFNSQIEKRIRQSYVKESQATGVLGAAIIWIKSPFTWAAASAFCLLLFLSNKNLDQGIGSTVVSTYSPDPSVSIVSAGYNEEAGATVIKLEGLERIPDDTDFSVNHIVSYDRQGPPGFVHFYNKQNEVVYIMETDEYGLPNVF
ncbi:MAG TPA: hypothetical protein EYG40_11855 [Verrucomicrobia bacterium]|nr:hypothetical protein [Verrucomicrobiales bacterium]HIL55713.1 hypothetical protein [Verrucomicrobiota bacterium]